MSTCLHPINPTPFQHDPGAALLNLGLAATRLWERTTALPRGDPARAEHLQTAIRMRQQESAGWLAVRTPQFPASDLAGAAQAALAIGDYYHDLGDGSSVSSAREWVRRAVTEAPPGTTVALAARISARRL